MQFRDLGASGARVSAVGLGCMGLIGWYGVRDDAEAAATLLAAVDLGVNHFDTAQSYQNGANEQFVGSTLRAVLRQHRATLFIASKFGVTRDGAGRLRIDNRPDVLREAVDGSLKRLGLDYIDLYYLHRIDQSVPIEESVGTLKALVDAGKIRHIGLSECSVTTLQRAHRVHPITAVQYEYSLWTRDAEAGVLAACRELGVGFVAYSPLGRGFLAGLFRQIDELPADDWRRGQPRFLAEAAVHNTALADVLAAHAKRRGCTPAQLALAWVLAQDPNIVVIPGTKRRTRLAENLGAAAVQLDAGECRALADEISRIGVQGDRYPPPMMAALNG